MSETSSGSTEPSDTERDDQNQPFPIVGIGASAGGLEAFTQLLRHLPIDTGMAFVLIQHLNPNQKSLLSEILARATAMLVLEVEDGMMVEPNCVYVIPPNAKMTIALRRLNLTPRDKTRGIAMPVDAFFLSLAEDSGQQSDRDRAIGRGWRWLTRTRSDQRSGWHYVCSV